MLEERKAAPPLTPGPSPSEPGAAAPGGGGSGGGTEPPGPYYAPRAPRGTLERWKSQGGIMGALATLLLILAKAGAPVLYLLAKLKFLLVGLKLLWVGKFLLTGGSMLVSMWAWAQVYGWGMGAGIVLLIFVHESGHALAARLRGIPTGIMVFLPLMGAFVTTKKYGRNLAEDAFIGIMGPVFGTLGGLVCLAIYAVSPSPFWLVLAMFNFFINLFNLLPTPPLDGGWIAPLFSPKLLAVGVVLLFVVAPRNPMIWLLALMSVPRIIAGWKADPATQPYYQVTAADRWKYGLAYVGLAAFLALSYVGLHDYLIMHRPVLA